MRRETGVSLQGPPARTKHKRFGTALLGVVFLATTFWSHRNLQRSRAAAGADAHAAVERALSPAEVLAATALGGFRPILINILWIRIGQSLREHRTDQLAALYGALKSLQGDSPRFYYLVSEQMALDVARRLRHRPEERWEWIHRGLATLEEGRLRFPEDPRLHYQAVYLYYWRFHEVASPEDRKWFMSQARRADDPVPFGRDPLELVVDAGERALALPGHSFHGDRALWVAYVKLFALRADTALLDRAERLLDHMEAAHRGPEQVEVVRPLREDLNRTREAAGRPEGAEAEKK